jgi:ribosomal protein S18 acetylase RimI-like enzyme
MRSDDAAEISIRLMNVADRSAVAEIVEQAGNFNQAEVDCALELVDIYLSGKDPQDYRVAVASNASARVCGYACWGPTPMTKGTFDLYWIATHPSVRGQGFGRALLAHVEEQVQRNEGRLLVVETSSKESYRHTTRFYRSLGYEETSRIRDFYDVGDDKIVLVKEFSR